MKTILLILGFTAGVILGKSPGETYGLGYVLGAALFFCIRSDFMGGSRGVQNLDP